MLAALTFSKPPGPNSPEAQRALLHCLDVLGWKDAYIPSVIALRDRAELQAGTVYRYQPVGVFDTPEEFYFTQLDLLPGR
jgi:hypothetical protein